MIKVITLFLLGLFLVIKGGDWFVDSSIKIAKLSGLPQIFIGATIVSIATTLPELIVSITATLQNQTIMAVGNGIGSIICNTGLILSLNCIIGKVIIDDNEYTIKYFFLLCSVSALFAFGMDNRICFTESIILFFGFIFYICYNLKVISKIHITKSKEKIRISKNLYKIILFFVFGISFITLGSNLIINNGIKLAEILNVPSSIISLTLISLGTSLPELVTCISSLIKKNAEIGIGNIIGANILNCLLVIGTSGLLKELYIVPHNITVDIPIALILTFILSISLFTKKICKAQGLFMLCIYLSYIILSWNNVVNP
ncbi:calcium/sodium antiporter [Sedimentibacter sp. zth1]|uniref:calcium/sodium antiporter n=1 Tax=Sedimentibacter sp. zth1 TaxID=2816908 RepID=UPI001A9135BF|nr:calcium/sodium antiporter [Sedimentibacter sp. zth1]QSX05021.1 calcium/sodium antiporter [Sedimentibacter sp. zth1]